MKYPANSVQEYLDIIPQERRVALNAVRKIILKNLPKGYEEAYEWGMISYQVPLTVYPDTYNKKPLMYAALASQKNYMAIYLMCTYGNPAIKQEIVDGFKNSGKKLDMGGSCLRFKKLEDLPLDVIAKTVAAVPMDDYIAAAKSVKRK